MFSKNIRLRHIRNFLKKFQTAHCYGIMIRFKASFIDLGKQTLRTAKNSFILCDFSREQGVTHIQASFVYLLN